MFFINGTQEDAALAMKNLGLSSTDDANKIISYILMNPFVLNDDEYVELGNETCTSNAMGMLMLDNTCYINLRKTTIILIAMLLDMTLTKGLFGTALTIFGVSTNTVCKIHEYSGEKCIIQETLKQSGKKGDKSILLKYSGRCQYPQSSCKYHNRQGNDIFCCCAEQNVFDIYEDLHAKHVFKKDVISNVYYYQF